MRGENTKYYVLVHVSWLYFSAVTVGAVLAKQSKQGKVTWESHDLLQQGKEEKLNTMLKVSISWESKPGHRVCELKHQNGISGETRYCTFISKTWLAPFFSFFSATV